MAAIFENRNIHKNDLEKLKFPRDTITANLPPCCRDLPRGKIAVLEVEVDQGVTHSLTIKNDNGKLCFTDGWKEFAKNNSIKEHYEISLYKENDNCGSGAPRYLIKVKKAKKRDC